MLNLPTPFGNMGKFSSELWSLAANRCSSSNRDGDGDNKGGANSKLSSSLENTDAALLQAAALNAEQVHRYLNTYASHTAARFPAGDLKKLNIQYDALPLASPLSASSTTTQGAIDAYLQFLNDVQVIAQHVWTQFNDVSMILGLLVFALSHIDCGSGRRPRIFLCPFFLN